MFQDPVFFVLPSFSDFVFSTPVKCNLPAPTTLKGTLHTVHEILTFVEIYFSSEEFNFRLLVGGTPSSALSRSGWGWSGLLPPSGMLTPDWLL